MRFFLISAALLAVCAAQQNTTPVPILKQINRHNEDGSYSYGYEAADGSYKIESKYPTGEVFGKYGFVDDTGKLREIEYGASRRGFEPAGNEINVPPPTLNQNNDAVRPLGPNEEDDGQYREDPSVYYKDDKYNSNNNQDHYRQLQQVYNNYQSPAQPAQQPAQAQQAYNGFLNNYQQPRNYQPAAQPAFRPQTSYNNYQQQPQQVQQPRYYNPAHPNFNPFGGHPASNFDVASGSYSVQYRR